MTDRELMQQALDALDLVTDLTNHDDEVYAAIDALRARLAQPESAYLIGARLFREGKGISFIPTAVPIDNAIGEALQGWEDAKTAEEIAQPEPEPVAQMREMLEVQGRDGTWNCDQYSQGMFNGMELMVALAEGRDPVFREAPERWLHTPPQREWQGLTDEEIKQLWKDTPQLVGVYSYTDISREVEAKLKEKNGF